MPARTKLQVVLTRLGFTVNEAQCYQALLEHGEQTVPCLARITGIDRSNTYDAVYVLEDKGIVSHTEEQYGKHYFAVSPRKLATIAACKRRQARRHELELAEALPDIMSLHKSSDMQPHVQLLKGTHGILSAFEDCISGQHITEIYCCTSANFSFIPNGTEYDNEFTQRRLKLNIRIKVLAQQNTLSSSWHHKDMHELRETRFIPPTHDIPATTFIYGNTIASIPHSEEQTALIIHSKELAYTQRALFDFMWKTVGE
jgi:sugar-specific transcriptional regulator TrmB